ncbi:hypothetical protein C8A00DRAFT_47065 [Chaetomidium leptoderma]|uniref:Uncharacterized protein n=1 Tax=Chaetomidium leptoderma TaxID=669021 RepID=A0AAN6VD66_9PEZI|nr:hypothetical protein C8A00DRAFT_47065 [Chaetomidium leptoderma]
MKSKTKVEAEVRSWGFSHVFTWTDGANTHYPPHSHTGLTTHVILSGQLTIAYPEDGDAEQRKQRTVYGVGDRIDVDAGRVHEVWIGAGGCIYVIGE